MKTIRVDADVFEHLNEIAQPGETAGDALRRTLAGHVIEVDDDTYSELVARSEQFGETASDVIRRILGLAVVEPQAPTGQPDIVTFHLPAGTGPQSWNSQTTAIHAHVGDTLRIINHDSIGHRPHTDGKPFAHPAADIAPGESADYMLISPFNGRLYDHNFGPGAEIWINVE